MNPNSDEATLAVRARDGDRDALAELVERVRSRLFALAYAELRHYEDARDAVAAALYQICLHASELREPEKVRAWMQSIVRNECRRMRRGRAASEVALEEADELAADEPPFLRLDIDLSLRRLPPAQAKVLRCFYLEGMPIRGIASLTGRREGTIKYWLHEGRQKLAQELEGYRPMAQQPKSPETPPIADKPLHALVLHEGTRSSDFRKAIKKIQAIGFEVEFATRDQIAALVESPGGGRHLLRSWWMDKDLILMDDWIGGRPALEVLINARAVAPEDAIPAICLLSADPPASAAYACWNLGVDILVDRKDPGLWNRLYDLAARLVEMRGQAVYRRVWPRFTPDAKAAVIAAQREAAAGGFHETLPEHLLIGILLQEDSGIRKIVGRATEAIVKTLRETVPTRAGGAVPVDQVALAARTMRALDSAGADARQRFPSEMGTENLVLGILREGGPAAAALQSAGADLQPWIDHVQHEQFERWRGRGWVVQ